MRTCEPRPEGFSLLPIGPELWGSCSVENVSVPWELQVLG